MAGIQPFSGGSTSGNLLGNSTNSSISDSQNPTEPTAQSNTAEQQFSGMTTEERLKSSQSPLDQFLSDTSPLASDTADAVTDLATDAYQGMKAINQEYALGQRAMGALKVLGGAGEAFVGGVGVMAPEPLTSVGGAILFVHGSDVVSSGFQEMWTGKPIETVTDQVATESAKLLGADDATAQKIGDGVDMGLSLGSAGVGAYQALTRPVIAELGPMTVKSSPKAKPASELNAGTKTQAGNDAALTAEVAESVGPAGKLQAVEGVSEVNAPEVTATMRVGSNAPNKIAQGFTKGEFAKFAEAARRLAKEAGLPKGQLAVQGSRAKGTARPLSDKKPSDIDIILRVDEKIFNEFAQARINSVRPGTKLQKTLIKAAEKGQLSRFDISKDFNKQMFEILAPKSKLDIDFSIVKEGSKIDTPPFIDLGNF